MSRLYAVESLFTLTGRMPTIGCVWRRVSWDIAAAISAQLSGAMVSIPAGVDGQWIYECAKDLIANGGNALVVAGQRQPREVHMLAHALNSALGAVGNTVTLLPTVENSGANLKNLDLAAIDTLVFWGVIRFTI
jgi:hypothetical protein